MQSLYRFLLLLYPARYREEYGREMIAVFTEIQSDVWTCGPMKRIAFAVREVGGLLYGACCMALVASICECLRVSTVVRYFHQGGLVCVPNFGFRKPQFR